MIYKGGQWCAEHQDRQFPCAPAKVASVQPQWLRCIFNHSTRGSSAVVVVQWCRMDLGAVHNLNVKREVLQLQSLMKGRQVGAREEEDDRILIHW